MLQKRWKLDETIEIDFGINALKPDYSFNKETIENSLLPNYSIVEL